MLGMVNSHPLNGAALATWVKAATVSAAVALTATVDATCVRGGVADLTGGASASATAIRVFPAASTGTSQAQGSVYPWYQAAGEAVLVGRATALAACERTVHAEAYGTATVTGSAIAESELGEVAVTAIFTIEAEATRNRPGRAVITAGATIDPPPVVFGQTVTLTAGSTARAEASVQLSGEGFWRHDGYAEADATGVLSQQVTWSVLSVPLGMDFTLVAEATRRRPAMALLTVSCTGSVDGLSGVPGEVDANAQATGAVVGTRVHGAQATGTAGATGRLAAPPRQDHAGQADAHSALAASLLPTQTFAGQAVGATAATGSSDGTRVQWATATPVAQLTLSASGGHDHPSTAEAAAGAEAIPAAHATQHYAAAEGAVGTLTLSAIPARSNPSLVYLYGFCDAAVTQVDVRVGAQPLVAVGSFTEITLATSHLGGVDALAGATVTATQAASNLGAVAATLVAEAAVAVSGVTCQFVGVADALTSAGLTAFPANSNLGRVEALASAGLTAFPANSNLGRVEALAGVTVEPVVTATSHKGTVQAELIAQGTVRGGRLRFATVDATVTAMGRALGLRRGDLNAPPERSMILSYEPRGMIVPEAERTLWVPA